MCTQSTSGETGDSTMTPPRLFCLLLALFIVAPGRPVSADVVPVSAPKQLTFVAGDDVWVPGWVFNNSDDWLGLSCTERACQLVAAGLRVTPASWQGHHDDLATSGQRLGFSKSADVPGEVVAWIRRDDELPWLEPRSIELYFAKELTPVIQDREDTYEIVIASQNETREILAPVLRLDSGQAGERTRAMHGDSIYLQVRASGAQQLLSEQMAACTGRLSLEYLLWSGDLDGDGETDYLIDYTDTAQGTVRLYLSSYAGPGQLVGEAGVGITHPLDGHCD